MDTWADLLAIHLEGSGIILYLLAKYVDDINLTVSYIEKGYSWMEEQDVSGKKKNINMERTMTLIKELGDKLVPGVKLTIDIPEFYNISKCPILDIQVWMEEDEEPSVIRHTFFM